MIPTTRANDERVRGTTMTAVPGASVREILIATEFSDEAEGALRVAVDYARRFGARLHLLHVFSAAEVDVTRLLADAAALAAPDVSDTVPRPHLRALPGAYPRRSALPQAARGARRTDVMLGVAA